MAILSWSVISRQVEAFSDVEMRKLLGRKRLRVSRHQIAKYVFAIAEQQRLGLSLKAMWRRRGRSFWNVDYAGLQAGTVLVAPLGEAMLLQWLRVEGVGFNELTSLDTSLIPSKKEHCMTDRDWEEGRATRRPKQRKGAKGQVVDIIGRKLLTAMNGQRFIVHAQALPINLPDVVLLLDTAFWQGVGMRHTVLLVDKGFPSRRVRDAWGKANATGTNVRIVSPPKGKHEWLPKADAARYRERWHQEVAYCRIKDHQGHIRLNLTRVRRLDLQDCRIFLAVLAYNRWWAARLACAAKMRARRARATIA